MEYDDRIKALKQGLNNINSLNNYIELQSIYNSFVSLISILYDTNTTKYGGIFNELSEISGYFDNLKSNSIYKQKQKIIEAKEILLNIVKYL